MKIPKYIKALIKRRTRAIYSLDYSCNELNKWLDKNDIKCTRLNFQDLADEADWYEAETIAAINGTYNSKKYFTEDVE